jgi:hypothetical protein
MSTDGDAWLRLPDGEAHGKYPQNILRCSLV